MAMFKLRYPLNEDGNVDSVGPIAGIMSMAEKRGFEKVELELYNQEDTPNGEFEEMSPEEDRLHEFPWDTSPEKVDRVAKVYGNLVQTPEGPATTFRPGDCYTTKQVAEKIFGCGEIEFQRPFYTKKWKEILKPIQLGPNGGKKCKLYFPKTTVNNYAEMQTIN